MSNSRKLFPQHLSGGTKRCRGCFDRGLHPKTIPTVPAPAHISNDTPGAPTSSQLCDDELRTTSRCLANTIRSVSRKASRLAHKMNMAPRKGTRRACDPCSVRKVRCDGNQPCSRCEAASWECTYLKTPGKSGPKGPRRTTEAAIRRLQERSKSSQDGSRSNSEASFDAGSPITAELPYIDPIPPLNEAAADYLGWPDTASPSLSTGQKEPQRISVSCISQYLDIYQVQGYGIWPVVDAEALTAHLPTNPDDLEAYALATACLLYTSPSPRD